MPGGEGGSDAHLGGPEGHYKPSILDVLAKSEIPEIRFLTP